MVRKASVVAAALASAASPAAAEDCPIPLTLPSASEGLSGLIAKAKVAHVKKDEFETTAAYQRRAAAAASGLPQQPVTVAMSLDRQTKYDADSQTVSVSRYAFSTTCLIYEHQLSAEAKAATFGKRPREVAPGLVAGSAYCRKDTVERKEGTAYEASNSYGATVTVEPFVTRDEGLYFGYGETGQEMLRRSEGAPFDEPAFSFTATPDEARSLKDNGVALYLARLRAPYFLSASYYIEPTISSPTSVRTNNELLVVEPLCVAIADKRTGKVYQSRAVNAAD